MSKKHGASSSPTPAAAKSKKMKGEGDEEGAVGGGGVGTKKAQDDMEAARKENVEFYFRDGLRCVHPYDYVFNSFTKRRWIGQSILDVFAGEFQSESPEYYRFAIANGRILVNGKQVTADTKLKDNSLITHHVHRHEPPVCGEPLTIVYEDAEVVVINKPASIPVHPCGRYRHNTALLLMGHLHGLWGLHTCHRLDRLTSGLLILAKSVDKARQLENAIISREVAKVYVCRTLGLFPLDPVDCNEPLDVACFKLGFCTVSAEGKPSHTRFELIRHEKDNTSIVRCRPTTGRMHQIRVHLQHLGYPISNDPIYRLNEWGIEAGKGRDPLAKERILAVSAAIQARHADHDATYAVNEETGQSSSHYRKECTECNVKRPDPTESELCIFLHAISYAGPGWSFETPLPPWALEGEGAGATAAASAAVGGGAAAAIGDGAATAAVAPSSEETSVSAAAATPAVAPLEDVNKGKNAGEGTCAEIVGNEGAATAETTTEAAAAAAAVSDQVPAVNGEESTVLSETTTG